jgi:hypothetical protein
MIFTLTGSLKITGKSNLGKSMYKNRFSDFSVSACFDQPNIKLIIWLMKRTYRMYLLHLAESHRIKPIRLRQITSLVLLHELQVMHAMFIISASECGLIRSLTFSNLPISSRSPSLLGVVDSIDPSASWPGQSSSRCFPLRNVL